jgi:hypothetical protein
MKFAESFILRDKRIDGDGVFVGFEHPVQNFFD